MRWTSEEDRAGLVRMNDQLNRWMRGVLVDLRVKLHRPRPERRWWRRVTDQDRQETLIGAWVYIECDREDEPYGSAIGLVAEEWWYTDTDRPEMVRLAKTDTWWPASWIVKIDRHRLAVAEVRAERIMHWLRTLGRSN